MKRGRGAGASRVLAEALAGYKRARAQEPGIRLLDLRGLAGIGRGEHEVGLHLLDFAVAPSLRIEPRGHEGRIEGLLHQLDAPDLAPVRRDEIGKELAQLENERWNHPFARDSKEVEPRSFAMVLHAERRFTVIGDPGAGKSVLTRLAFLACIDGRDGDRARALLCRDDGFNSAAVKTVQGLRKLLPVRLALGRLGGVLEEEGGSIERLIRHQLQVSRAPPVVREGLQGLLEAGRVFLLCDGLDEVAERHRGRVVDGLESLLEQYPDLRLLLTSRPHGYRPRVTGLAHTWLVPLHPHQQRVLVTRLHRFIESRQRPDARSAKQARRRTEALLRAIQPRREWSQLGSNPLLLTLSALTPTQEDGTPRHRVFVFENFVRTLVGEWRAASRMTSEQTELLLDAWSAVSFRLVRGEERRGVSRARMLRLLEDVLEGGRTSAPVDARAALHLALETGLVRQEDDAVSFWHSTFAEFLAARALTGNGRGASKRLLAEMPLPPLVLELAAARIDHVLQAREEADALASGLLRRDREGADRLLRPGLRAVSSCLAEGVRFSPAVTRKVWAAWASLLESTPPSPPWADFGEMAERAPLPRLPRPLVARLARIKDRGMTEVREGLARAVAWSGSASPVIQEACERWLGQRDSALARLHGAYGLAAQGDWSPRVIEVLGGFAAERAMVPEAVAGLVRRGGARLAAELRRLVELRLPSEAPKEPAGLAAPGAAAATEQESEQVLRGRRVAAACLLAISGVWDAGVAEVLRRRLAESPGRYGNEVMALLPLCAARKPVQESLLEWLADDSNLGHNAREVVRDVAPVVEGMTELLLERTGGAGGRLLQVLEELLAAVGEERRTLRDRLWRWLEEDAESRRMCAVRILQRIEPGDEPSREALLHGMRSGSLAARARWARLAISLELEKDAATAALQACAHSPEPEVRQLVYEYLPWGYWGGSRVRMEGWLACAEDPEVPPAARFAAAELVWRVPELRARAVGVMRELLDVQDSQVRRSAAQWLLRGEEADERAVVIVAEEAARAAFEAAHWAMLELPLFKITPFAAAAVRAMVRGLPREPRSMASEDPSDIVMGWASRIEELAIKELSCAEALLSVLDCPGPAGLVADAALRGLASRHPAWREPARTALARVELEGLALMRLVYLGLEHEETHSAAIEASRRLDVAGMTPGQLEWLARQLHAAGAENDAARLWTRLLDAENLEVVLVAAEALGVHFPESSREWVPRVAGRLLAAAEPMCRVRAARLALRYGCLEEEAVAALQGCLDVPGHRYSEASAKQRPLEYSDSRVLARGPFEDRTVDQLHRYPPRADFEAVHALHGWRPQAGLDRLVTWLEDEDRHRWRHAVKILAERSEYRELVRAALEARLTSAPPGSVEEVAMLIQEQGFYSPRMGELLIARLHSELPEFDVVERCVAWWLRKAPELWGTIRCQEPARRSVFMRLLRYPVPISREVIALVVERAFAQVDTWELNETVSILEAWCQTPRGGEQAPEREPEAPSRPLAEEVKGWLREVLTAMPLPSGLLALQLFDSLAAMSEMPVEQRLEALRRALAVEGVAHEKSPTEQRYLIELQARAARRLLELGGQDERVIPILEGAVYELARVYAHGALQCADALLTLRPPYRELRDCLILATTVPEDHPDLGMLLRVLAKAGLSRKERIDALLARLHANVRPSWLDQRPRTPEEIQQHMADAFKYRWAEAPQVLDALASLGFGKARRTALLLEFLAARGSALSIPLRLVLVERPELPKPAVAKLLLSVIAQGDWVAREGSRQWRKRFAPHRAEPKEEEEEKQGLPHWDYAYRDATYLLLRLRAVEWLSQVEDGVFLMTVLAELIAAPSREFVPLYRRACSRAPLSRNQWKRLLDPIALRADDDKTLVLAKELLSLRLWKAVEPATLEAVLRA